MIEHNADGTKADAIALIRSTAAELADIHRAKTYGLWRGKKVSELDAALAAVDPFRAYADIWMFTGDHGGCVVQGRFGEWVIDRLVEHHSPEAILGLLDAEVDRNVGRYTELSPLFGVELDASCDLGDGISLEPPAEDMLARMLRYIPFQRIELPTGTAMLCQSYTVTPAFAPVVDRPFGEDASTTTPAYDERDAVRKRLRLACLLASVGAVELPISAVQPDRDSCFVSGAVSLTGRPFTPHPLVSFPIVASEVATLFEQLGRFSEVDSLARAIDRLGRSRLAVTDVDKALELGMAAEIALMHDHSTSNTEITHKIGSRAAWLLGESAAERALIFDEMKHLYQARSVAVHSGALSSRSKVDLMAADRLVTRALAAIAAHGRFPDWHALTMGGTPEIEAGE